MSYNRHIGPVWPDECDDYKETILTMDENSREWFSIKIKTVKRVENFINNERHVLSYCTTQVGERWINNHCVFVKEQLGEFYNCVDSWGDYDSNPTVPVKRPGNILWMVQAECEPAPKC